MSCAVSVTMPLSGSNISVLTDDDPDHCNEISGGPLLRNKGLCLTNRFGPTIQDDFQGQIDGSSINPTCQAYCIESTAWYIIRPKQIRRGFHMDAAKVGG